MTRGSPSIAELVSELLANSVPPPSSAPLGAVSSATMAHAYGDAPDLVHELVRLALVPSDESADRLAQLAALEAQGLLPPTLPPAAPAVPRKRTSPMQARRRRLAAMAQARLQYEARNKPPPPLPSLAECRALERTERNDEAKARYRNRVERPTRVVAAPIGVALDCTAAALRVRQLHRRKHAGEERQAIAEVARKLHRANIEPIRAALGDLHAALERSRLAPEQLELIDRSLTNVVRLFHRGELDREDVLAQVWMHQRSLAQKRRELAAAAKESLQRVEDAERERAIALALDSADPFERDVFEHEKRALTRAK